MNIKTLAVVSVLILAGGALTFSQTYDNSGSMIPCQEPLTYRFGDIDPRFDITKPELAGIMKEVESLWSTALDRKLLNHQRNGKVAIHLIYGEDQKRTENERAFARRIEKKKLRIETTRLEYEQLAKNYEQKKAVLQQTYQKLKKLIEAYNARVADYSGNKREGKAIKKMEREIKRVQFLADQKQQNAEFIRKQGNERAQELNSLLEEQQKLTGKYYERFSEPKKFNQGRYTRVGNKENIKIFQFANTAELKTVLAHEAGHAFGLDHIPNPKAIMHSLMGGQDIFDLQLTPDDIQALKNRCN